MVIDQNNNEVGLFHPVKKILTEFVTYPDGQRAPIYKFGAPYPARFPNTPIKINDRRRVKTIGFVRMHENQRDVIVENEAKNTIGFLTPLYDQNSNIAGFQLSYTQPPDTPFQTPPAYRQPSDTERQLPPARALAIKPTGLSALAPEFKSKTTNQD